MLLNVENLSISFDTFEGKVHVLDDVSFSVNEGEILSIVGESGSGKSVSAYSILGLLDKNSNVESGKILFENTDLLKLDRKEIQSYRGKKIGMVFQEPMTALHPTMKVGKQLLNVIIQNSGMSKDMAREIMLNNLKDVHFDNPEEVADKYPYELSGGMRQRIVISLAMSNEPKLLIADEPTTALDVTIQAEILNLMKELVNKRNTAILLITHDFSVVRSVSDKVCVMYGGKVLERGYTDEVLKDPKHPYTRALLNALPDKVDSNVRLQEIKGEVPDLRYRDPGCIFYSRCPSKAKICGEKIPLKKESSKSHSFYCWEVEK
ncbi:ABC transporter ATP-binding protein [Clostridium luticellarii]|uniref:Oligopeptide transport ATP-binding protein OppD n=1 Tax=Clostridium luticellarii TaxID=1691940 RepID=A0A2T0BHM3_9CLOT|nr:ABC transporter ATP-binding protein [Clostridium luticellarii]MCI1943914.1 ABC transporter ATP-binding protein [Clostridium luticellarii]MCI1967175.1 ABC transporter ATP-binding protein [Clostridium luticellarii]MCI1994542.1 ABC transporter ATP-binding protein [Clostridium luticellarii]MCI2038505.1 ABC transporter ATP-binding protein [Clostridium luticellarii]PRR83353.1 Oligopeptide transport ATP-binding protein OppD [Clostridium luticellarii]